MKKLWFDPDCPICAAFKGEIESRTMGEIEFVPSEPDAKSFKYENELGVFEGRDAIAMILKDYPNLVPALSVLPKEWREAVMASMVQLASVGRSAYKSIRNFVVGKTLNKPCNCGKD